MKINKAKKKILRNIKKKKTLVVRATTSLGKFFLTQPFFY